MKFYKLTTSHTQSEIDEIIMSMSKPEIDFIIDIYTQISMVEYTDKKGFECMFAILNDLLISKLESLFQKYMIKFEIKDITKDVIFDNDIHINYKNCKNISVKNKIIDLINEFKSKWVTKDDILDKILEKGVDSLTITDLEILNY